MKPSSYQRQHIVTTLSPESPRRKPHSPKAGAPDRFWFEAIVTAGAPTVNGSHLDTTLGPVLSYLQFAACANDQHCDMEGPRDTNDETNDSTFDHFANKQVSKMLHQSERSK